jgi:hypothetical protein
VFTDGLIERRTEDIDEGRAKLSSALVALAHDDLGDGLRRTVATMGAEAHEDDVAAVALRRHTASPNA